MFLDKVVKGMIGKWIYVTKVDTFLLFLSRLLISFRKVIMAKIEERIGFVGGGAMAQVMMTWL